MDNLAKCLRYYIADRLSNDPGWRNLTVCSASQPNKDFLILRCLNGHVLHDNVLVNDGPHV